MRGGQYYANHGHTALTEIGITADPGGYSLESGSVRLGEMYRPAEFLSWHREHGWSLCVRQPGPNYAWRDIPIGPPEMTPGKAARAVAKLLTAQAKGQADATRNAVCRALGEEIEDRLGWETVRDLRNQILSAMDADVLAAQDGGDRG